MYNSLIILAICVLGFWLVGAYRLHKQYSVINQEMLVQGRVSGTTLRDLRWSLPTLPHVCIAAGFASLFHAYNVAAVLHMYKSLWDTGTPVAGVENAGPDHVPYKAGLERVIARLV